MEPSWSCPRFVRSLTPALELWSIGLSVVKAQVTERYPHTSEDERRSGDEATGKREPINIAVNAPAFIHRRQQASPWPGLMYRSRRRTRPRVAGRLSAPTLADPGSVATMRESAPTLKRGEAPDYLCEHRHGVCRPAAVICTRVESWTDGVVWAQLLSRALYTVFKNRALFAVAKGHRSTNKITSIIYWSPLLLDIAIMTMEMPNITL